MALYIAEVQGANGCANRARVNGRDLVAFTSGVLSWEPLRVESEQGPDAVALFKSRALARETVLGCVWNGQRFQVRAALGNRRKHGVKVGLRSRS